MQNIVTAEEVARACSALRAAGLDPMTATRGEMCRVLDVTDRRARTMQEWVRRAGSTTMLPAAAGDDPLISKIEKFLSKREHSSVFDIADELDCSPKAVRTALQGMRSGGMNVELDEDVVTAPVQVLPGTVGGQPIVHDISSYRNQWFQFGAIGDNHLGSKHERLDVLNAAYDMYKREGITAVFNTGNMIEGEMRLNFHDVKVHGLDAQVDYFIEHYPQRDGITTYFVAGDDHEGWYQRNSRLEIGRFMQLRAEAAGRFDLKYMGFVEADVKLQAAEGHAMMKVMHPGGGSAYALSYAPQKLVESFQGGEKPQVLLIGHYHKSGYEYPREVHVVQTACTVDQSIFMRKNKISAHVGFAICRLNQAVDGTINRFQYEYFPFYDRNFYTRRDFGLTGSPSPISAVENGVVVA